MRSAIAATMAVAAGLFAANMLGVAVAEAPTGTPLRTISVQGVGTARIGQSDSAAAATAVYREGMASAILDGQSKAQFLVSKVGAALGTVQSVVEGGGYINCTGATEGYGEYEGEQPDFGSAPLPVAASAPATRGAATPQVSHGVKAKHPKRKRTTAKKAAALTCTLTAQVALVYTLN